MPQKLTIDFLSSNPNDSHDEWNISRSEIFWHRYAKNGERCGREARGRGRGAASREGVVGFLVRARDGVFALILTRCVRVNTPVHPVSEYPGLTRAKTLPRTEPARCWGFYDLLTLVRVYPARARATAARRPHGAKQKCGHRAASGSPYYPETQIETESSIFNTFVDRKSVNGERRESIRVSAS